MNVSRICRELRIALADLLTPAAVPGYAELGWRDRWLTDLRTLRVVVMSPGCRRVTVCYAAWWLAGKTAIWRADIVGLAAYTPELTALLWLLPLAALGRRRALRQVLGPYWSRL